MDQLITAAKTFLNDMQVPWAVCGGYALDLFLGRTIRVHSDIDICVFECDRDAVLRFMLQNDWRVYEFRGQGKVRPLDSESTSDNGRNLMCVKGVCNLVKFYPCDDIGLLYHEFLHIGIDKFNYVEFLFNQTNGDYFVFDRGRGIQRELSKAILFHGSIPYLAPEIVLLHKSLRAENAEYQFDFEQTYCHMSCEQKEWFSRNLDRIYPNGHVWKSECE